MNTPRIARALALLVLVTTTALHAQVPQIINYQGRIAVGTASPVNFDGSGAFKFALVNDDGTTTYWSNDDTSAVGSQPTAAVTLTVTKGLYSVLLGDTTLAGMTAIPNSVFANADVRLRVWFDDGTNGSQLLTPDQRLAAVGYAMVAGGVNLPATTSSTSGVITQNGSHLIHSFGTNNFFAGVSAGNFTMTGTENTASGESALANNTTGNNNTATGRNALFFNTTGSQNTAGGESALANNTTGNNNTATGQNVLSSNTTGSQNTASGESALSNNTTGNNNTASGQTALNVNTTGSDNTALGFQADVTTSALNNATAIGANAKVDASNKVRIGDDNVTVIEGQVAFTFTSDRTKKENFLPVDGREVLEKIRGFELTSWNYTGQDAERFRHYGVMAQDFHAAFGQDAVGKVGTPTTVNSGDMAGVMMSAIKELATENKTMRAENVELRARLERLEARIGK